MALVPDQKFGTFADGGDLAINDIVVGLRNNLNTRFTYTGELPPGYVVPIEQGGTDADNVVDARANLGLGTMATQNSNNVNITGGGATFGTVHVATNTISTTSGNLNITPAGGGQVLVPNPTLSASAATKNYVDTFARGFYFLPPAAAATTVNLAGYTYNNGSLGIGATLTAGSNGAFTVDGVSPSLNAIILVKNQSSAAQNGVYRLTTVGNVSTPAVLTRADFYDEPTDIDPGDYIVILAGTTQLSSSWVETQVVTDIGTDPISFTQVSTAVPVPVSQGGTSRTTLTSNAILYGDGTNQVGLQTTGTGVLTALGQNLIGTGSLFAGSNFQTFTPSFSFATPGDLSVSYNIRSGRYTRIGNTIFFYITLQFTPTYTTSTGSAQAQDLPFSVNGTSNYQCGVAINETSTWPTGTSTLFGSMAATAVVLNGRGNAAAPAILTTGTFPTATQRTILITGFYQT